MVERRYRLFAVLAAGTILWALTIVIIPTGDIRQLLVFVLVALWPTVTWALYMDGPAFERLVTSGSLALLLNALVALGLLYLPGATPRWALLSGASLVALLPLLLMAWRGLGNGLRLPKVTRFWVPVLCVAIVALVLRLGNVAYKELQGDEGIIMVRAAAALTGREGQLFLHQKGPAEILLPLELWGLGGAIDDFWVRVPFIWAGLLGVAAVGWLGTVWFGQRAGLIAALLWAVNGFAIAFSRIAQYQMLVVLWGCVGLITAWRYRRSGRPRWLYLTTAFLAGGLLAHYDAVLFAPAAAWAALGYDVGRRRLNLRVWAPAVVLGVAIAGLFYVPYALDPSFGQTLSYLVNDRLGAGSGESPIRFAGADVWRMITFYNSLWYVLGLVVLIVMGLWQVAAKHLTFAAVLLFTVPVLFYGLLVADPRTHVYTLFPGGVILAGLAVSHVWERGRQSRLVVARIGVSTLSILWLAIVFLYVYLMFVDVTPERQRTWAENRPLPALYPTTWDEPPKYGLFGFPYQAGWRVTPDLLGMGNYPYGSNEEKEVTNWYMAQAPRTHCANLGSYVLAKDVQDEVPFEPAWINDLHLQYQVIVNGEVKSEIFGGEPVQTARSYESTGRRRWLTPIQVAPPAVGPSERLNLILGEKVRLLGYDLDDSRAFPGGEVVVTLYWEALHLLQRNYQVFVHLYDGQMQAQDDSAPECAANPTSGWQPGDVVADPHVVLLPPDIPTGAIPVLSGMYDLITRDRLTSPDAPDGAILLTEVEIRPR